MGSLNKVQVIGNLGADPESNYLASGDMVVNLSLATTDKWKDKQTGEPKEKTEWHRISFFGKAAETIAKFCTKGSQLYVEGSLQTRKWQDKDGNDRYTTEIKGQNFQFLGGGQGGNRQQGGDGYQPDSQDNGDQSGGGGGAPKPQADFDDDIPF